MGLLKKLSNSVGVMSLFSCQRQQLLYFTVLFVLLFNHRCDSGKLEVLHPATEYCEGETYKAQCGVSEVIMIHTARYGLMHNSKCMAAGSWGSEMMQCEIDVIAILDERCSGRPSCSVNVVDVFQKIPVAKRGCLNKFRGFLDVSYKCITVLQASRTCSLDLGTAAQTSGYISSIISNTTKCGSSERPWKFKTAPEQRMSFMLYDFSVFQRNPEGKINDIIPATCRVYAVIKEGKIPNSDTVCSQLNRETPVYESMSDELEVRVMEKQTYFLLKYQAIGCGSVSVPVGGWVKRSGDDAVVGCDATHSNTQWPLHCSGNQWVGELGDCDKPGTKLELGSTSSDSDTFLGGIFGSHWFAILAISAIAITVAVCILIAGIVYIKRKHVYISNQNPSRDPYKYGTNDLPKPPNQGQSIYNSEGLPYRPFDPNDHEYLKTIERQRLMLIGQHPQQHFATLDNFHWPERPETEHIYELPKFETDPNMRQINDNKIVPPPPRLPLQQFELDPRMVTPSTNNANEGNRNVNNRSV